jgi:hypothetical protein
VFTGAAMIYQHRLQCNQTGIAPVQW